MAECHTLTQGLRDPRQKCPQESLPPLPSGVVDWHGHTHTLRDVVECYGNTECHAQFGVGESGDKCGQSFREVVDSNGQPWSVGVCVHWVSNGACCVRDSTSPQLRVGCVWSR